MRRLLIPGLFFIALALCAACANATPTATVEKPPTVTAVPTATITPVAGLPTATPAFYPNPTPDPNDPPHAPGALRNTNWPQGTAAVASYAAKPSVDIDI